MFRLDNWTRDPTDYNFIHLPRSTVHVECIEQNHGI